MGERFYNERYPKYKSFSCFWWGRYYCKDLKKRLHKLERIAAKREIQDLHVRKSLVGAGREVNWRGW